MIKTQVQIPDKLFERAKRVAAEKEWSFAEIVRRGLEYMTAVNPSDRLSATRWRLAEPSNLGLPLIPEEQWSEGCHD